MFDRHDVEQTSTKHHRVPPAQTHIWIELKSLVNFGAIDSLSVQCCGNKIGIGEHRGMQSERRSVLLQSAEAFLEFSRKPNVVLIGKGNNRTFARLCGPQEIISKAKARGAR